ncbi:hypothetical protein ACFQ3K_01245 [Brucella gallinifaecis]|uniref:Uncharacterized protein n=1 Tax=Brucella gallinifaecis TaxID=215590 RepID=A0A502BLL8_9HYPH|nr:hypothetical protein [Brucella gallinifaecis]TPF74569.1 hypothetical protein FHY56_13965 [Brucella gallinifaecis]
MLGRSFLMGIALGIAIGIYIAPSLRANLGFNDDQQTVVNLAKHSDDTIWPDDETARTELFRLSNWNYADYGHSSKVSVLRCIPIKEQTVACELSASLSWLNEPKAIEAVFEGAANDWRLVAVKSR